MSDEKSNVTKNTGYPPYDLNKIPAHYMCCICKSIYVEVVQANCGCRYCSLCLDALLQKSASCKTCGEFIEQSKDAKMFDKAFQKELNNFIIDCIKCKWNGKLCEYSIHYDGEHVMILVNCDHCNKSFPDEVLLNSHLNNDDCPLKPAKCLFGTIGCKKLVKESELNDHLKSNNIEHSKQLNKRLDQIQEQFLVINKNENSTEKRLSEIESVVKSMINSFSKLTNEIKDSSINTLDTTSNENLQTEFGNALQTEIGNAIIACTTCKNWQGKHSEFHLHYKKEHSQ